MGREQQPTGDVEPLSLPSALMEIMEASMRPQTEGLEHMIGLSKDVQDMIRAELAIIRDPQSAYAAGLWQSRGVLLHGPTGVGKTTITKAIAAAAGRHAVGLTGNNEFAVNLGDYGDSITTLFTAIRHRAVEIGGVLDDEVAMAGSGKKKNSTPTKSDAKTLVVCLNEGDSFMMDRMRMGHSAADIDKRQQVNDFINSLDAMLVNSGVNNVLLLVTLNDVASIDLSASSRFRMLELKGPTPIQAVHAYMDNINLVMNTIQDGKDYFAPGIVERIEAFRTARTELKQYVAKHPKASAVKGEKNYSKALEEKATAMQQSYDAVSNLFSLIVNDPQLGKLSYGAIEQILINERKRVYAELQAKKLAEERAKKARRGTVSIPEVHPISIRSLHNAAGIYYRNRAAIINNQGKK